MILSELIGNYKILKKVVYIFFKSNTFGEVETNYIKRIPFAAVPVEDGADGSEIEMIFPENYYQLHEIFKIEKTGQQCFVVSR